MDRNRILQYIIHLTGWGIVFCFPLFFVSKNAEAFTWLRYFAYVIVPIAFMVIFYTNYFVLIDRLLFRKKLIHFLIANVLMLAILTLLLDLWREYYFFEVMGHEHDRQPGPPKLMFLLRDGAVMALTAALSVAIKMTQNWYITENDRKELEKVRTEAELQNLKNQLNPHFLFNTLNNIYSLVVIDTERAQLAIHDLSRLLRHVLYEDKQPFVPLEGELDFMRSYIELMSLRLSEKVDLQVDFPDKCNGIRVAPLLFITLIENAFKHGVGSVGTSFIHIRIEVKGSEYIECCIKNTNNPKTDTDRSGSGIGLANLCRRLELLYPDKYELDTIVEANVYTARLKIML